MRIEFIAIFDKEEDGISGSVTMTRDDVDDLYSLLHAYQDFTVSAGFSYSEAIGCRKDDDNYAWSDF